MKPEVIDFQLPPILSIIDWEWRAAGPRWIDIEQHGSLIVIDRQIDAINVRTKLDVGDVLLAYGIPDHVRLIAARDEHFQPFFQYDGGYAQQCRRVLAEGSGPLRGLYYARARISFQKQRPDIYQTPLSDCGQ